MGRERAKKGSGKSEVVFELPAWDFLGVVASRENNSSGLQILTSVRDEVLRIV